MVGPTVYQRVLGAAFDRLPPVLRAVHGSPGGARAAGRFRVTRGRTALARVAAVLLGLPPAGDDIALTLEVRPDGERERWVRDFGGRVVETTQWARDGKLVEASGPGRLGFRLAADARSLRMDCEDAWLLAAPLPGPLRIRAAAVELARDDGWDVDVTIAAPGVGLLVRYEGALTLVT